MKDRKRRALEREQATGDVDAGQKLAMGDLRCGVSRVDKIRKFIGKDVLIQGISTNYIGTLREVSCDSDAGPAELWLCPIKKLWDSDITMPLALYLHQMEITEEFMWCIPWDSVYSFGLAVDNNATV